MGEIRVEIDYVECTEGTSNKWYLGCDLGSALGMGIVAYGAMDKVQSFAICARADVGKKLSEKRSPKKRYTDERFGNGWSGWANLASEIESRLTQQLANKGLYESGDSIRVERMSNGAGYLILNLAKAITPAERKAAAANPPPPAPAIDKSKVFGDW